MQVQPDCCHRLLRRAAFVPLDASWPAARVVQVAQQAGLDLVVDTSCNLNSLLPAAAAQGCSTALDQQQPQHQGMTQQSIGVPVMDTDALGLGSPPMHPVPPHTSNSLLQLKAAGIHVFSIPELRQGAQLGAGAGTGTYGALASAAAPVQVPPLPWCYVLFTSGSTGQPQGVLGTEGGILNRCAWMQHQGLVAQVRGGASGRSGGRSCSSLGVARVPGNPALWCRGHCQRMD